MFSYESPAAAIPLKKSRKEKQYFLKGILLSCFFNCLCCSKDCCVLPKRCCCPVPLCRCHYNGHFGGSGINHCRKPCPWVFFCVVDISFLSCLSPLFILFARVSFFIKESVWNFSAKKEHKMFKLCLCHVHILFKISRIILITTEKIKKAKSNSDITGGMKYV